MYYAGFIALAILWFYRSGRKRRGMRLRLKGGERPPGLAESEQENVISINGHGVRPGPEKFSHIEARGERPLNVVFNYNGHSWDAYEVLGLPAGSSPEKVDQAFRESLASVDIGSRSFIEAAYRAIQLEWRIFKASGGD